MRIIELDAEEWKTVPDFYSAVLAAIGAPNFYGRNLNALVDSMIWGGINAIEPPYTIRILRTDSLPENVRNEVAVVKEAITKARRDFRARNERDVEIALEW
jgi:RNAse (barnase) inhibitor barstar